MNDVPTADKIYHLSIALDNALLVMKERTKKIEDITNHEELIRECDCLYQAYDSIGYVLQELLNSSEDNCNHANDLPTEARLR